MRGMFLMILIQDMGCRHGAWGREHGAKGMEKRAWSMGHIVDMGYPLLFALCSLPFAFKVFDSKKVWCGHGSGW